MGEWGTVTALDLQPLTEYCFLTAARNGDGIETGPSPEVCETTGVAGAEIVSAQSCRDHGPAGWLCVDLGIGDTRYIGDNVEPRAGGVQRLEFVMDGAVSSVTASVSCEINTYSGTATPIADGTTTLVVTFDPGLPDQDCCEITLGGQAEGSYWVAVLAGDVDRDREVLTVDASKVKSRFQDPVDETTATYDVDCDGQIITVDASKVKGRFQNTAPRCPP
jgi:hypothetical protein